MIGVFTTYAAKPEGNGRLLALGVACVMVAIVRDALADRRRAAAGRSAPLKGIVLSVVAGVLMGWFYSFVAQSIGSIDAVTLALEPHKLSPYTAIVLFSAGVLTSNLIWKGVHRLARHGAPAGRHVLVLFARPGGVDGLQV